MATLVSPGVSVTVVDESAYASPGTGTIPFIAIATRSDKSDPTGTESDELQSTQSQQMLAKLYLLHHNEN